MEIDAVSPKFRLLSGHRPSFTREEVGKWGIPAGGPLNVDTNAPLTVPRSPEQSPIVPLSKIWQNHLLALLSSADVGCQTDVEKVMCFRENSTLIVLFSMKSRWMC